MNNTARIHVIVSGEVQGVGFRMFVLQAASALGATGWVRNTLIGDVEVLAEGRRDTLDKLVQILGQGPRTAQVSHLDVQWLPATGEFHHFEVKATR